MYMYMYLSDSWKILISSEAHNSETKIAEFQVLKKHIYITLRKVENFNAVTLHVAVLHLSVKTWEYLHVCYKIILSDSKVGTSLWDVNLCDVVKSFLTLGEQLSCLQRK